MDILSMIVGALIITLLEVFVVLLTDKGPREDTKVMGTLYVHTSEEKETYSFAFDGDLEEIKNHKKVLFDVKVEKALTPQELLERMDAE